MPTIVNNFRLQEVTEPAPVADDRELLRRFQEEGDEIAFDMLVRRHLDPVYSAALRQLDGDHTHTEDVTQSVFVELYRKAGGLLGHPALSGWLLTTTRLKAQAVLRTEWRRTRREKRALAMSEALQGGESPDAAVSWEAIRPVLDEEMHRLGEVDRAAVLLRHFEGKSFAEIGKHLELSPNAARMRVERALDKLRMALAKRGGSSPGELAASLAAHAIHAAPPSLASSWWNAAIKVLGVSFHTARSPILQAAMTLKSKIAITALIASALITPIVLQQRTIDRLRLELAQAKGELDERSMAEADTRQASERSAEEAKRLRESQTELLRLRSEVGELRERLRAARRPPQVGQEGPSPERAAGPSTPLKAFGANLADLGSATAERAASSLIWAATEGHTERIADLLELPASVPESEAPRHYAHFAGLLAQQFRTKEFTELHDFHPSTNGIMRLNFRYRDLETGKQLPYAFFVRRHESGWKIMVEGDVP